jgi:16S rRNA (uracil1498-N3)-methyltransferase
LHTPHLHAGLVELPPTEAHHARDVLRLQAGDEIEIFDDSGRVAAAVIERLDAQSMQVRVDRIEQPVVSLDITVAAAVPRGERADWMIEKLSEMGVTRFIPLATARSVVLPAGKNKHQRWLRLATESAKQSRRVGVMEIDELTPLEAAIAAGMTRKAGSGEGEERAIAPLTAVKIGQVPGIYLSTRREARPIVELLTSQLEASASLVLFIGPEGGWTDEEMEAMEKAGLTGAQLTATILRVETAAITAAAVVACWREQRPPPPRV